MRKHLAGLIFSLLALFPAVASAQVNLSNLGPNTVIGRLGIPAQGGPAQAISFAALVAALQNLTPTCSANTIMAGPATGPAASPSCRALVAADLPTSSINQRVITAAGAVTVGATDDQILVNKTIPATTTVNLPAASTRSARTLVVKDFAGIAAAFAITIVPNGGETIDGASTLVISTNRQSYTLVPISGTGWAII